MTDSLVLAHGFTQTARSWAVVRRLLAERGVGHTIAVDLPGHGENGDLETDLWGSADHLVQLGGIGTYVGYSMGGRVALHATLAHPDAVERLVLIGATAGIDDASERRQRRDADSALADRIERVGVECFIDEWLSTPLFAGLDEHTAQRSDRLRNTAHGLAGSLRRTGTGTQQPLWDRLAEIEVPVLVLVGELDPKFAEIGSRLQSALPHAELRVIAGAGHSVHLERPAATVDSLVDWLATH